MPGFLPFDFFKTKEELNMKCKPGDLAIIVDPYHPENAGLIVCSRRLKTEPPCRLKFEPGAEADFEMVGCG